MCQYPDRVTMPKCSALLPGLLNGNSHCLLRVDFCDDPTVNRVIK